nr:hypothetical protein [Tanacetum cinerariifolium]
YRIKTPLSSPSKIPTRQETKVLQPSSPTRTHVADKAASTGVDVRYGGAATTVSSLDAGQGSGNIDKTPSMPHDLLLSRVNTLESDDGTMTLNELTVLCTKLLQKLESLEADLKQTKKVYRAAYTKFIMKWRSMIEEIDQDAEVHLVTPTLVSTQGEAQSQESQPKDLLGVFSATKVLAEVAKVHTYTRRRRTISTASGGISTTEESVSTAGASMPEDIQATIKADEELALRIQAEEREKYLKVEKSILLVDLINQRKRHFAQQRAKEKRNKPMTQAQQRTYMSDYVKHMGSHTLKQLKKLSFEELKNLFKATMRMVKTFTPMESDFDKTIPKIANESSKRDVKEELEQESSKRQKTRESS